MSRQLRATVELVERHAAKVEGIHEERYHIQPRVRHQAVEPLIVRSVFEHQKLRSDDGLGCVEPNADGHLAEGVLSENVVQPLLINCDRPGMSDTRTCEHRY